MTDNLNNYIAPENIYWLFSSSAQAIAAFVAFLIAGYAFVNNALDGMVAKDETLAEVMEYLKKKYFRLIQKTVYITALAIVLSLSILYLNGIGLREVVAVKNILVPIAIIVNIASIIFGIYLVISMVDPEKARNAARNLIGKNPSEFPKAGKVVSEMEFLQEFIKTEKKLRSYFENNKSLVESNDYIKYNRPFTLRQMIEALRVNELVDSQLCRDLLEIVKVRNLVVHGHEEHVSENILERLKTINAELQSLSDKHSSTDR